MCSTNRNMSVSVLVVEGLNVSITRKPNLKNTYIRVNPPNGDVTVSAPAKLSDEEVSELVRQNLAKILDARRKFQAQPRQSKREYVSGETLYLWGNQYMLRVIYGARKSSVVRYPEVIVLNVPDGTPLESRRRILTEWYRQELKRAMPHLVEECCARVGVPITGWNIRNMRTRWGSCNVKAGRILLNLQLVKKPYECLEYVVIHELVHLLERNHTRKFWGLVEKFCPHWKSRRELLNSQPLDYHG